MQNNELMALGIIVLAVFGFSRGCQDLLLQGKRLGAIERCIQQSPTNPEDCRKIYGEEKP